MDTWHCSRTLTGHKADILSLAASLHRLFSSSADFTVKIWDREKLLCYQTFESTESITRALLTTQHNRLVSATGDTIQVTLILSPLIQRCGMICKLQKMRFLLKCPLQVKVSQQLHHI